jgi:hypothetical protein
MSGVWRFTIMLALLLAGASILLTSYLFTTLASEGADRRDQSCRLFEADHLADVEQLKRTYSYLDRQTVPSELTREIVRRLPELEREARIDGAPAYCDEPGVGLKEPDPVLPPRRDFRHLLSR